ncbi:MAG: class SAM-dependent methyltransferase [Clostridia bacterium]|jgi:SAM-dependent methyltransferase|nr:class SAM-dependent methyltransferase [Clostridia bacterium]
MNKTELMNLWKQDENQSFKGWDFSYISKRHTEEGLPWDYKEEVKSLIDNKKMLDMGTGGGEFLISLQPKAGVTYATESYPPNIELCKRILPEYGIEIRAVENDEELPFNNSFFDLVINRHESFSTKEVYRILNSGGRFVTQQVGGKNNKELSKLLLGEYPDVVNANFNLENTVKELENEGFKVVKQYEFFPCSRYYDIGAIVYFARIIEWEFPGFSVDRCFDALYELHEKLEREGYVESMEHRFFIEAIKE